MTEQPMGSVSRSDEAREQEQLSLRCCHPLLHPGVASQGGQHLSRSLLGKIEA